MVNKENKEIERIVALESAIEYIKDKLDSNTYKIDDIPEQIKKYLEEMIKRHEDTEKMIYNNMEIRMKELKEYTQALHTRIKTLEDFKIKAIA